MAIEMKITKTNHRHKAQDLFAYYVKPEHEALPFVVDYSVTFKFNEWRMWAWETWGPSAERDSSFVRGWKDKPVWAWHTEDNQLRLYLRS